MNGIHEVTGSTPVWSTNLRSPVIMRRLSAIASRSDATADLFRHSASYGWQAMRFARACQVERELRLASHATVGASYGWRAGRAYSSPTKDPTEVGCQGRLHPGRCPRQQAQPQLPL